MKHTLLTFFILALLCSCQNQTSSNTPENKTQTTKNISEADRVKIALVIPALDALSYQLEKVGYDTEALNKINKFLKENSVSEFLEKNEIVKEIEKVLESGKNKRPVDSGKQVSLKQQEVFETF